MTTETATLNALPDDELWRRCRAGQREAFECIVARYQSLVCALAYSACGNVFRSEDLAQETFLLGELRDPTKLRAWLCGIVRNLEASARRREFRRGGPAQALEQIAEPASDEADPSARAVDREEEAVLWRSLVALPENYREPLVLFYREGQSIARVASSLGLTEETVRQRLSRGRAMLREEIAGLVEGTLSRTRPGSAFTIGVLVALPAVSATTAGAVASASAVVSAGADTAAKGMLAKLGLSALAGPLIGLAGAWLGSKAAASTGRSPEERACILKYTRYGIIVFCLAMSLGLAAVLSQAGRLYTASALWLVLGIAGWAAALVGGIMWICQRMDREVRRIRLATNTTDELYAARLAAQGKSWRLPRYFESRTRLLGLPIFAMAWGGHSADRHRNRMVCAWIAVGDIAVSPLLAFGGLAVAPIGVGAISIGVLSLSVFWGVAFGFLAVGSLAFGWWSLGCAALGVRCAAGFAAAARDYAVGSVATAKLTGAQAFEWIKTQGWTEFAEAILQPVWWIGGCALLAAVLRGWMGRRKIS